MTAVLVVVGIVALIVVIWAFSSIKIVREYQRIVLFRVGRMAGTRGPGLVFLIPFIDRPAWVDLREQYLEIPQQTGITKDNAPISIDFIVFHRVVDAVDSVVKVQNFAGAARTSPRRRSAAWSGTCRSTTCSPSARR